MLNSAGNRLVHFIFTNSHVQPSYNESRGEVMLEGLVLLPPRRNDNFANIRRTSMVLASNDRL